jgi:hypothetical protein
MLLIVLLVGAAFVLGVCSVWNRPEHGGDSRAAWPAPSEKSSSQP